MDPDVEDFLAKFSRETEQLVKNIAQCWQIAQQHNHVAKSSLKKYQQTTRTSSNQSDRSTPLCLKMQQNGTTQTCCKEEDLTRKFSEKLNKMFQPKHRTSLKQLSSKSSVKSKGKSKKKREEKEDVPTCKRSCKTKCYLSKDANELESATQKQIYCSKHGHITIPIKPSSAPAPKSNVPPEEIAMWVEKFSEAQQTIQLLRNKIIDMDLVLKQEQSKTAVSCEMPRPPISVPKRSFEVKCKPESCPFSGKKTEKYEYTGFPKLPKIDLPEIPRLPGKMGTSKCERTRPDPFEYMPDVMPNAVPILPGSFIATPNDQGCTPRTACTPRTSCTPSNSCRRVSFG